MLEFLNLVVPINVIKAKYIGEWEQCLIDHERYIGTTVWHDDYLFRDGAMNGYDIGAMVDEWTDMGFEATEEINGETIWKDLCVVGELGGVCKYKCDWLSYEPRLRTAHLNGTDPNNVIRMVRPKEIYIPNPKERQGYEVPTIEELVKQMEYNQQHETLK